MAGELRAALRGALPDIVTRVLWLLGDGNGHEHEARGGGVPQQQEMDRKLGNSASLSFLWHVRVNSSESP